MSDTDGITAAPKPGTGRRPHPLPVRIMQWVDPAVMLVMIPWFAGL